MALHRPLGLLFSTPLPKEDSYASSGYYPNSKCFRNIRFSLKTRRCIFMPLQFPKVILVAIVFTCEQVRVSRVAHEIEFDDGKEDGGTTRNSDSTVEISSQVSSSDDDDDENDAPFFMNESEREELRRKIRGVIDMNPGVEEEKDPGERRRKMQKLLADYPLVVEEEDPDWPEDADGRGFNFDQFFNQITIKNVKKEVDDENDDSDKEIVWQDDNYIRPIKDITAGEWEDTVFKDFNPLVILVHNRYKRPQDNEKARGELEKAVQMFWETGLPSPRCVAIDAVVEQDLVSTLRVSGFPEILFTKAGKILHREKVVRTADEMSKMMAFFYYKAVRPLCLDEAAGHRQENIPFISL